MLGLTLFCLPFLILGVALTYREVSFLASCSETRGVIVRWEVDDTSYPVFEFTDPGTGEKITKANPISGGNYRVGDQVDIIYDPHDPTNAQIKDSRSLVFLLVWTSLFALVTVLSVLSLLGRIHAWTAMPIRNKADLEEGLPPFSRLSSGMQIESLRVDEKVIWRGKPSKMGFMWQGLVIIPFLLSALIVFAYIAEGWSWSVHTIIFFLVGACAFILIIPYMMLRVYRNTDYVITDQRVITQSGLGLNLETSIEFNEIQGIYVKVGLVDRIFGTGTVIVTTVDFTSPRLAALKEPHKVQELLQEAVEKARRTRTPK